MKHDWKKQEKQFYQPKPSPELIQVPAFKFFTVSGEGNPNSPEFANYIEVLYALSYAIRMSPKKGTAPDGYVEYTVYPLEGIWDVSEDVKKSGNNTFSKDDLVFKLMIRQPDFVTSAYAQSIIESVRKVKKLPLLEKAAFECMEDGWCMQMLHEGPYDDEPASFQRMEEFADKNGWHRKSKIHREIYLSDARKTEPSRLKTVLRFQVNKKDFA